MPEVIAGWKASGSFGAIDLDAFEGMKVEAPGIISFPALTMEFRSERTRAFEVRIPASRPYRRSRAIRKPLQC